LFSPEKAQIPLSTAQQQDKRQWAQTGIQEILFKPDSRCFIVKVTEHWNRLPREVVVSTHGDIQNSTGQGPRQLALDDPLLSRGLGLGDLQTFLLTSATPCSLKWMQLVQLHDHVLPCVVSLHTSEIFRAFQTTRYILKTRYNIWALVFHS